MADIGELVIQIQATAEGLEATIQNASQLVRKFAQEAEAATSKPFEVQVQTDSLKEAISGMIGLGERVTAAATAGAAAGMLLKAATLDIGTSLLAAGLTWLMNAIIKGIDDMIHAKERAEKLRKEQIAANDDDILSAQKEADSYLEQADRIRALGDEYSQLRQKRRTESEERRFLELQKELADSMGTTEDAVYGQAASFNVWENAIKKASDSQIDQAIKNMEIAQKIQEDNIRVANENVGNNIPYTTPTPQKVNPYQGMMITNELTQAQKVEAEYLGVIDATAVQVGNMAKMSETMAGSQIEAANQSTLLAQSFGEAMTPVAQAATEVFIGVLSGITGISEAMPWLTAGVTGAAGAFTTLAAAASGVMALKKTIDDFNIPMKLTTPLGIAAAALGVLAGIYTAIKNEQERMAKAEEERIAANKEAVVQQQGRVKDLEELTARYQQLSGKSNLNYSEQRELLGIQNALATSYGITAANLDGANQSAQEYLATLQLLHAQELKDLKTRQEAASKDAYTKANSQEYVAQMKEVQKYQNLINEKTVELEIVINKSQGYLMYDDEASIRGNLWAKLWGRSCWRASKARWGAWWPGSRA